MCGRFALTAGPDALLEHFSASQVDDFPARYNIAPTQPILIVIDGETPEPGSNQSNRKFMLVRWGFTPSWVKDPRDFPLLTNARAETAIGKASFKVAMRHRRILVPASGFYEWHRPPKESGRKAQPYWVRPKRGGIVAFGGLMETWSAPDGSEVDTAAILTCAANSAISSIHHRMPVVIQPEDFTRWLDCKTQEPRHIVDLMRPADDDFFEAIAVSDKVNKVANSRPEVQTPLSSQEVAERSATPDDEGKGNSRQMSLF